MSNIALRFISLLRVGAAGGLVWIEKYRCAEHAVLPSEIAGAVIAPGYVPYRLSARTVAGGRLWLGDIFACVLLAADAVRCLLFCLWRDHTAADFPFVDTKKESPHTILISAWRDKG